MESSILVTPYYCEDEMGYKCKWIYKQLKKAGKTNWGHRLYDKDHPAIPENSIAALRNGLKYQIFDQFRYWEFDVVESSDGILFVFHDATKKKTVRRLCPTAPYNLIDRSLYDIASFNIKQLRLMETNETIPTLAEIFSEFSRREIIKPIHIEIKKLMTTKAKKDIVLMANSFRNETGYTVKFMMFRSKFNRVFKDDKDWFLGLLKMYNFELIWI